MGGAVVAACVPPDDAGPRYGSFAFDFVPSDATRSGFTTDDGWSIAFTRTVVVPPSMSVRRYREGATTSDDVTPTEPTLEQSESCRDTGHSTDGLRFFVGTVDPRVGWTETWNRLEADSCDRFFTLSTGFAFVPVDEFTRPGPGTTETDIADLGRLDAGIGILEGTATKEATTKRFVFTFTLSTTSTGYNRSVEPTRCQIAGADAPVVPGERVRYRYAFRGEAVFRDSLRAAGALRFDPMAEADDRGDHDGIVTSSELAKTTIASLCATGGYRDLYEGPDGGDVPRSNLEHHVSAAYASVWRLESHPCVKVPARLRSGPNVEAVPDEPRTPVCGP
ncbi:MAG: hypothetical protein U0169_05565 [Polyangiaceae bacterium]